jgi:hypothetical protein
MAVETGRMRLSRGAQPGPAVGYLLTPDLGAPAAVIGMEWSLQPNGGGDSGAVILGTSDGPLDPLASQGPRVPVRLLVNREGWNLSLSPGSVGGDLRLLTLVGGFFEQPLAEDGTLYRAEVRVDGDEAIAELPDGSTKAVADPRIAAWAGRFGYFGAYSSSATDSDVGIAGLWADT